MCACSFCPVEQLFVEHVIIMATISKTLIKQAFVSSKKAGLYKRGGCSFKVLFVRFDTQHFLNC
jgi:hypothetical protein